MAETPSAPGTNAGEQTLRLDADRTRDELADALAEIRRRLTPRELAKSVTGSVRRHPAQVAAAIAATAGIVTATVVLVRRARKRG
jgi:hypothetical protein